MKPNRANEWYMMWWNSICNKLYDLCISYWIEPSDIVVGIWYLWWLSIKTNSTNPEFIEDIHRLMQLSYETCFYCWRKWKMRIKNKDFITICNICEYKLNIYSRIGKIKSFINKVLLLIHKYYDKKKEEWIKNV